MGSFGADIDLRFNTASALKDYKEFTEKAKAMMKEVAAGVEGSEKKLEKLQSDFARTMISTQTRQGRALETSIKSLERQAELAGKTYSQQLLIRQEKWIKMLGEDEAAVKRVTAAFKQLIKAEEEAQAKRGHGGMMSTGTTANLIFRGTKDVFEGRGTYAAMDFITAAKRMQEGGAGAGAAGGLLGGATMGVVGLTAAFAGLTVAGAHASKSMGDYAESVREIQGITGMTVREVQMLDYSTKASGHTIEDVVKGFRGLTQALEGGGSSAVKAGKDLKAMNVDVVGLKLGTVTAYEALEQMGEALKKNPDIFKTNIELMDIFKKSGLNIKYVLTELANTKAIMPALFTEEQFKQMDEWDRKWDEIGAKTSYYFKQLKYFLGQEFMADVQLVVTVKDAAGNAADWFTKMLTKEAQWEHGVLRSAGLMAPEEPPSVAETKNLDQAGSIKWHRKMVQEQRAQQFDQYLEGLGGSTLEGAEAKLRELERDLKERHEKTPEMLAQFVKDPAAWLAEDKKITEELEKQKKIVEGMRDAESDRKNIKETMRRADESVRDRMQTRFELPAQAELRKAEEMRGITAADKWKLRGIYYPLIEKEREEQADKLGRQMLETQQGVGRQMARARMGGIMPVDIRQLGKGEIGAGGALREVTRADVVSDIAGAEEQRKKSAMDTFEAEYKLIAARKIDAKDTVALEEQRRAIVTLTGNLAVSQIEAEAAAKRQMYELDKRERELAQEHELTMSRIRLADQEEGIKHQADLAQKIAELRFKGANPAAGIAESYRIATELAQSLYDQEMKRIDAVEVGYKKIEDQEKALHDLHRADEQAREEFQLKMAQMQQEQLDKLKSTIEPLYHTLFTDPSKFGAQLRSTLQEAALKPITSGLSEMTATALHPLIYGAGGTGGIAGSLTGMFGGGHKFSDLTLLPDRSVPVTIVNDQSGGGGAAGGGGGGAIGGGPLGIHSGGLGARFRRYLVNPAGSEEAMLGEIRSRESSGNYGAQNKGSTASGAYQFIDSTWRMAAQNTGLGLQYKHARDAPQSVQDANARWLLQRYGPNATQSWAASGPYGGGGGGGGGEGTPATMVDGMPTFSATGLGRVDVDPISMGGAPYGLTGTSGGYSGGGGTAAANLAKMFMGGGTAGGGFNLKSLTGMTGAGWRRFFGQGGTAIRGETMGGESLGRVGGQGMGGGLKGFAGSPAARAGAGMAGSMLAQAGLMGEARGTVGGVFEGMIGGAGVGFSMGGPIGAAIGAAAGLGIGIGEMIAGVESPRREAKRLVQSIYHISINNTTADQIVNMANQSYGGRVSIAVRSPEVRHMLGLYSAGTGQGSIYSVNEARGASLVESGGVLSQQATYQYGRAFTHSSSLPVYGGGSTQVVGAPGGSMNLSLNIGGQDAARFMTGQVVTPDVVQTQYASAMHGSAGRVPQALMMSEPGAIAS